MEGLIEFLESASGPIEAAKAWDIADRFNAWGSSSVERELFVSALQGSIDAALALAERVLPGCLWTCGSNTYDCAPVGQAEIFLPVENDFHSGQGEVTAATPALAICAALLRAFAAEGAGQ